MQQRLGSKPKVKYSLGSYNKIKGDRQRIRITEGCPHNCPFCYEPQKLKIFEIPKLERNIVEISDMNLLCKPEVKDILYELGSRKVNNKVIYYELISGIDYRFLTEDLADALYATRFRKIRLAWDWGIDQQYKIKDAIDMLVEAGYKREKIMVFMICNWKIPHKTCMKKLDLLKVWNVTVSDCYYDNQTFPNVKPIDWTMKQLKDFRKKCRDHNIIVKFKIYGDKCSRK